MEQGSVSRSSAAGQCPARQESTKSEAVPSAMPVLLVKSSVVSPLKLPQSPGQAGPCGWAACGPVLPCTPVTVPRARGRRRPHCYEAWPPRAPA